MWAGLAGPDPRPAGHLRRPLRRQPLGADRRSRSVVVPCARSCAHRLAILTLALVLLAPAGALAQDGNPFDGSLPPAQPTPAPTPEPDDDAAQDDVGRNTLWIIGGGVAVALLIFGFWISRDARSNLPRRRARRAPRAGRQAAARAQARAPGQGEGAREGPRPAPGPQGPPQGQGQDASARAAAGAARGARGPSSAAAITVSSTFTRAKRLESPSTRCHGASSVPVRSSMSSTASS